MALTKKNVVIEENLQATKVSAGELLFDAPKVPEEALRRYPELKALQSNLDRHWYNLRTVILRNSAETQQQQQSTVNEVENLELLIQELQEAAQSATSTFQSIINKIASGDLLMQYDWDDVNSIHHFLADIKLDGLDFTKFLTVDSDGVVISASLGPGDIYTKSETEDLLDLELNVDLNVSTISFNDNTNQVITIGDKTTHCSFIVEYKLTIGSRFEKGTIEIVHDGVTIDQSISKKGPTPYIDTITFITTFVGNDVRLNLNTNGVGDPATFKYDITQKIAI